MLLAITDILCTIPLGTYVMFNANAGQPLRPWISWADTHFDFWRIVIVPAIFWRSNPKITVALELTRWLPVFSGFVFFALFGFASEAKKHYSIGFWWLAKRLNFKKPSPEKHPLSKTSWKMLPRYVYIVFLHSDGL
jgi:pheromone a factor receptor